MKKDTKVIIILVLSLIVVILLGYIVLKNTQEEKVSLKTSGKVLATVNGINISEGLVNIVTQGQPVPEENKKLVVDELIDNILIYHEALKSGIEKDTILMNQLKLQEIITLASKYMEKKIKEMPAPTQDEIIAYFQLNKPNFDKNVKIAIIVLPADKGYADSIYNLIKSGKKSFETVAKEVSLDKQTGQKGGAIDTWFTFKQLTSIGFANIDSVAFSLKNKGEISTPFAEINGTYNIVKLVDFKPSNLDENTIKGMLTNLLYSEKSKSFIQAYTQQLREKAKIEYKFEK
ncbi:MAG: peptidylprolyl isomerase [candidate division WOR-3 bacterium]